MKYIAVIFLILIVFAVMGLKIISELPDPPPISLSSRESLVHGYVLKVISLHDKPLEFTISGETMINGEKLEKTFVIKPGKTQELGFMELDGVGFGNKSGGRIKVRGYDGIRFEFSDGGKVSYEVLK